MAKGSQGKLSRGITVGIEAPSLEREAFWHGWLACIAVCQVKGTLDAFLVAEQLIDILRIDMDDQGVKDRVRQWGKVVKPLVKPSPRQTPQNRPNG